ncbi:MAG TPA: hypothetical protein VLI43_09240 [Gemmatimonadaceae bacterium]|nr:hypothetical protein [Gemmatimonadaceae bacterium]
MARAPPSAVQPERVEAATANARTAARARHEAAGRERWHAMLWGTARSAAPIVLREGQPFRDA